MTEEVRQNLKAARDHYHTMHTRCPQCKGTSSYWITLCGFTMTLGKEDQCRNLNEAHCNCGWVGIVHDLEPR